MAVDEESLNNLASQGASTNKERLVVYPDGTRVTLTAMTCQVTAAHHILALTGRISLDGMKESIDTATDEILGESYNRYKEGQHVLMSSADVIHSWLVQKKGVPALSLYTSEDGRVNPRWRDQVNEWLLEGGVVLRVDGFHATTLVLGRDGIVIEINPGGGTSDFAQSAPIDLSALTDSVFPHCFLIPPKPKEASAKIIADLKRYRDLVRPYLETFGAPGLFRVIGPCSWPILNVEIIEKDYDRPGIGQVKVIEIPPNLPSINVLTITKEQTAAHAPLEIPQPTLTINKDDIKPIPPPLEIN